MARRTGSFFGNHEAVSIEEDLELFDVASGTAKLQSLGECEGG